jgi:hypothetical protein
VSGHFPSDAWLASANWDNPRRIAESAQVFTGAWSPDGSKLIVGLLKGNGERVALAIFDLATERISPPITGAELAEVLLPFPDGCVTDGTSGDMLRERTLAPLSGWSWSADGQNLLAWAVGTSRVPNDTVPVALILVPLGAFGTASSQDAEYRQPRLLALGTTRDLPSHHSHLSAVWSPTDSSRLTFTWTPRGQYAERPETYLLDVDAGVLFSDTMSWGAAWSPDAQWLAIGGKKHVTVVDGEGQHRFVFPCQVSIGARHWFGILLPT